MIELKPTVINWISINDRLPLLRTEVLIANNRIWIGELQLVPKLEKINGFYQYINEKELQWGIDENRGEYWIELENVTHWAEIPKLEKEN